MDQFFYYSASFMLSDFVVLLYAAVWFLFPISFIQPELSLNLSLTVDRPQSLQAYTNRKFLIEPGDENREGTYGICRCISW